jgi:pyrimidine-nucleoside phosphorylase
MARSILDLIVRKRDGAELTTDEIYLLIEGISSGDVPEYQIGALLMAIYLRGMTDRETADLTMAMAHSGDILNLSAIPGFKADKHSTGGVGDKVTLILGPLVASAGVYFPKLSGRGLGHTGGTLDKLESIPGFRVDLSIEELIKQVTAIGLAVTGQTGELVPADGILYGLRDVTGTVDSVPLIASSVMSKKIAAGADGIVLDVKAGHGAFMRDPQSAERLARLMVSIGEAAGKPMAALVTAMDEPLGAAVGNALEVAEAIEVLRGQESHTATQTLREVTLVLGAHILTMAGNSPSAEAAETVLDERLRDGAALGKLCEMIEWQGGNPAVVDDLSLLPRAQEIIELRSPTNGWVQAIDALQIGLAVMELGAGRKAKGEPVDHAVGAVLEVEPGDPVNAGQLIATIHTNGRIPNGQVEALVLDAFRFGAEPVAPRPHILAEITS